MKSVTLKDKSFKLFIEESTILNAVDAVAEKVNKDLADLNPVIVCVLGGSFMFTSDLVKRLSFNPEIQFVKYSSYHGTESVGTVSENLGLSISIENRNVLIIEDIVDRGNTLEKIYEDFKKYKPLSLRVASLLFKPNAYQKDIKIDYVGMEIGNEFIVGYGLDYDGLGRNLKDIYIIN